LECAKRLQIYRGSFCGGGVRKGGKLLGLVGIIFVKRKRWEVLVLGVLSTSKRHFWPNGYGDWVLQNMVFGRRS